MMDAAQKKFAILIAVLAVAIFLSGLSVVYVKELNRRAFITLQLLIKQDNDLETEWGQLLLEQSTLITHSRVEKLAINKLNMQIPEQQTIHLIQP